jgi:SAM-dependent methyltransferase
MTERDINFIKRILQLDIIKSPCLEIGTGVEGQNVKDLILQAGIEYFGADIIPGLSVDFVVNFESAEEVKKCFDDRHFGSILILNVLEHVFDPIRDLDNAFSILKPGGIVSLLLLLYGHCIIIHTITGGLTPIFMNNMLSAEIL